MVPITRRVDRVAPVKSLDASGEEWPMNVGWIVGLSHRSLLSLRRTGKSR